MLYARDANSILVIVDSDGQYTVPEMDTEVEYYKLSGQPW